jgi:hypothetical protein
MVFEAASAQDVFIVASLVPVNSVDGLHDIQREYIPEVHWPAMIGRKGRR